MSEKEKNKKTSEAEIQEIELDDLEQVTGGANPFAEYIRVPEQNYDVGNNKNN